jgi:gamma-glutamyltranspeptidase/glutathione hydrolase
MVEESIGEAALADLTRRGHSSSARPAWTVGRLTAAEKRRAATASCALPADRTPRLMQCLRFTRRTLKGLHA